MVHNGIEYGDMQLICEAYHLMKDVLGMDHDEMAKVSNKAFPPLPVNNVILHFLVLSSFIFQTVCFFQLKKREILKGFPPLKSNKAQT